MNIDKPSELTAEWIPIWVLGDNGSYLSYRCSLCQRSDYKEKNNRKHECPNCHAKMINGEESK